MCTTTYTQQKQDGGSATASIATKRVFFSTYNVAVVHPRRKTYQPSKLGSYDRRFLGFFKSQT